MPPRNLDTHVIHFFRKIAVPSARFGLFVIFFWFGWLKIIGVSPASALVQRLFEHTIPFMPFPVFLIGFGVFECIIGILFAIPGFERPAIILLCIHIIMTLGPLVLLPQETWQGFLTPTLEGQYIIKNLLIIACAIEIGAHMPLREL